jgi:nitric oxide reductase subunit B
MVRDSMKSSGHPEPPVSRAVMAFMACAALANLIAVLAGAAGALSYLSDGQWQITAAFRQHRSVHVVFATAWIYLAGVAVLHAALGSSDVTAGPRRAHLALWALAGAGCFAALCAGRFSGREYLEAHWSLSLPVLAGWAMLATAFGRATGFALRDRPVHHYMWAMSLGLFVVAFGEAHLWLIPGVGERPLRDLATQWKSYGTLVGTFNLLVYAATSYVSCLRAGSDAPARTRTAFALFFVGALNTFTNYGHHTFHVAQSRWVQWAGFVVSATELVIVGALLSQLLRRPEQGAPGDPVARLLRWGRFWSLVMVAQAIVLSIPPVNTLVHGTHLVMAHAMGSMIGIDSMLLLAALLELRRRWGLAGGPAARRVVAWSTGLVNAGLAGLVVVLSARGTVDAVLRALGPLSPAPPDVMRHWPAAFVACGLMVGCGLLLFDLEALAALAAALRGRIFVRLPLDFSRPPPQNACCSENIE